MTRKEKPKTKFIRTQINTGAKTTLSVKPIKLQKENKPELKGI